MKTTSNEQQAIVRDILRWVGHYGVRPFIKALAEYSQIQEKHWGSKQTEYEWQYENRMKQRYTQTLEILKTLEELHK